MKIKTDFVTNSSTTVYLCYIPEDLIIDMDYLLKHDSWKDYGQGKERDMDELLEAVQNELSEFKSHHYMDSWSEDYQVINTIHEALERRGCIIKNADVGGGEGTYYVGISDSDIENIKKIKDPEDENQVGLRHK